MQSEEPKGHKPIPNLGWIALLTLLPLLNLLLCMIGTSCFWWAVTSENQSATLRLSLLVAAVFLILLSALIASFSGLKSRQLILEAAVRELKQQS